MPKKRPSPANAIVVAAVNTRKMLLVTKAIAIAAANAKKDAATSQVNRVVARQLQPAATNTKKEAAPSQSNSSCPDNDGLAF